MSTNGGSTFTNVTGATSTSLTFTATVSQSGNLYRAVFTNARGSATTTAATLTVSQVAATVTAASVSWGTAGTSSLTTNADGLRLLPASRSNDLPWLGITKIGITLSQSATLSPGDVSVTGINVASYGPVTLSGSGTSYTITLAQPISAADRVTLTLGNAGIATYTRRLDVLPGDVNDDGAVTLQDAVLIRNMFLGFAGPRRPSSATSTATVWWTSTTTMPPASASAPNCRRRLLAIAREDTKEASCHDTEDDTGPHRPHEPQRVLGTPCDGKPRYQRAECDGGARQHRHLRCRPHRQLRHF